MCARKIVSESIKYYVAATAAAAAAVKAPALSYIVVESKNVKFKFSGM